jgi:hypothetical protein
LWGTHVWPREHPGPAVGIDLTRSWLHRPSFPDGQTPTNDSKLFLYIYLRLTGIVVFDFFFKDCWRATMAPSPGEVVFEWVFSFSHGEKVSMMKN